MERRRFVKTLAAGVGALGLTGILVSQSRALTGQRMVMVGWDGAGLNNVTPLLAAGRLPNLNALIQQGQLLPVRPDTETYTVPSWTAWMSGLLPGITGVFGNDEDTRGPIKVYPRDWLVWYRMISDRWTFPGVLKANGVPLGWFISKRYLGELVSPLHKISKKATEYLYLDPNSGLDDYAEILTDRSVAFIVNHQGPFFVFLHLNPDKWGHLYGENSPEYLSQFERADSCLGRFMALQQVHGFKLIVLTDHGFNPGAKNHTFAPDLWIATDIQLDPKWSTVGITNIDLAPTILGHYGLGKHHERALGRDLRLGAG